jgi:hypothetical protein
MLIFTFHDNSLPSETKQSIQKHIIIDLVFPGERRYALALVLIEGVHHDATVADVDLTLRRLLPSERVLHPVLVVAVGVVFTGVCTCYKS